MQAKSSCTAVVAVALLITALPDVAVAAIQRGVGIVDVGVTRAFFNPTLGQRIGVSVRLDQPGKLTARIVGPNGRSVHTLASNAPVREGLMTLQWDGRDATGHVVPNNAYGLQLQLKTEAGDASYDSLEQRQPLPVRYGGYDRRTAVISYTMPTPGRVHILAEAKDPRTGQVRQRLIANDAPRTAGAVIDIWDGFDAQHLTYLPDLPGFALLLTATELPTNAILTIGAPERKPAGLTAGVARRRVQR